ncbi:MAG: hypothetical protein J7J86_10225 [Bacteroidales bacterium]|nr:hypothetical protein [Bacteroidales bacterium]
MRSLKIGKLISYETSADIIIKTLSDEVDDSLRNVLDLQKIIKKSGYSDDLIRASINQKSEKLNRVSFNKAIKFKTTFQKYRYFYLLIFVFIIGVIIFPNFFVKPASRIIKYNQHFTKPNPFTFVILNDSLCSPANENFHLEVSTRGEVVPNEVYILYKDNSFKLSKKAQNVFTYDFINVQSDLSFVLYSGKYYSKMYYLKILPKPYILDFKAKMFYPKYVKKKNEILQNTGDFIVPEGTDITWQFNTQNTTKFNFNFNGVKEIINKNNSDVFTVNKRVLKNSKYSVYVENKYVKNLDSLFFNITILPDLFPRIKIQRSIDSVFYNKIYFHGFINDDNGFKKLKFKCEILDDIKNINKIIFSDNIKIQYNLQHQDFYYYFDFSKLNLKFDDKLQYYFEVTDNDEVHGGKTTKSEIYFFKKLSKKEIKEDSEKHTDNIKNEMNSFLKNLDNQKKRIDKLNSALIEKEKISWQEKQLLDNILKKQKEFVDKYQKINQENKINNLKSNEDLEFDNELLKKSRELEQLFDEVLDKKTKDQIEKFKKTLDELNKDKVQKMLDELKISNNDIEKQIERNLELFKNLEFEKKLNEIVTDLDKVAKSQDDISKEKKNSKNKETVIENQQNLKDDFNDIKEQINDLEKKNRELEYPNKLDNTDEQQDEISNEMNKALDNLKNNRNRKASKNQYNAGQKLHKLASLFKKIQSQISMQALGEDIQSLRNILESLIQLSFDQEDLINELSRTSLANPKFTQIINKQNSFKDNLSIVSDSLYSLSKRQPSIKPFVFKEIDNINKNIDKTMQYLVDAQVSIAKGKQQEIMTSVNNLSLIISEYLRNMQNQNSMMNSGKQSSSCPRPGSGQSSMKSLKQLQQKLNSQMQQMMKQQSQGGKSGKGKSKMSEELARLAAQQQAIREKMQDLISELQGANAGNAKNLNRIIKQMESTESDIINNRISRQTLIRQKEIMTRMLKSEKALKQKEFEKKRQSESADEIYRINPKKIIKNKNKGTYNSDFLESIPPSLKGFYKSKADKYFYYLHKEN